MSDISLLAKQNSDGSYSVAMKADLLVKHAFVDFYDEATGKGYQRNETQRAARGRLIERYIARCEVANTKPALFEMTANARPLEGQELDWEFEPLDDDGELGWLHFRSVHVFLSMIDGGTRLLGITNALGKGILDPSTKLDLRIYVGASLAKEVAYFLLINETQKKVRTDLSLRVVQQQISHAMAQLEDVTQQNASLVEQVATASRSLDDQAEEMTTLVSRFRVAEISPRHSQQLAYS